MRASTRLAEIRDSLEGSKINRSMAKETPAGHGNSHTLVLSQTRMKPRVVPCDLSQSRFLSLFLVPMNLVPVFRKRVPSILLFSCLVTSSSVFVWRGIADKIDIRHVAPREREESFSRRRIDVYDGVWLYCEKLCRFSYLRRVCNDAFPQVRPSIMR